MVGPLVHRLCRLFLTPCTPTLSPQAKADQFAATFNAALDALLAAPHQDPPGFTGVQPVNAISLCKLRWGPHQPVCLDEAAA
jgi:hypothetical protein